MLPPRVACRFPHSARNFSLAFVALLVAGAQLRTLAHEPRQDGANLALVATPSTSYVSEHETLGAIHDGVDPANSNDQRRGAYGNWPRSGTQWVQYEWDRAISTGKVDVYWWNDRRGVRMPTGARLLYWTGSEFAPVPNADGLGLLENRYNTTSFDEVTTTRLRLEIDSDGSYSTGVLEWKVYDSGKSPPFPPVVRAGVDRVVMLGGRTYLRGSIQSLVGSVDAANAKWTKTSGPGTVTFADERSPVTTATFSEPGDYVLELTGGEGDLTKSAAVRVRVEPRPPEGHLQLIDTRHYAIDSPLWNDRAKALIVNWIPHCIRKISDPELREGGINNFVDAAKALAGEPHQAHRGYVFSNAWVLNTIESICVALMVDAQDDAEILAAQQMMRETLDEWIPVILAAQEPDGYVQTAFTLSGRARWSPRHRGDHEGYVAGYFLEAAIAHYLMTDRQDARLYDAAKRLADCWNDNIGPAPKKPWYDGHQGMEIALVRFGRFVNAMEGEGAGDAYIALAKFLLDCRRDGSEYDQSHVPVVEQYEAVGHAVRASYSYAAMADVAMETGDIDYQSAVMSLWDNLVNRKYYVTGGIGSGETSEGFGPDYSLRHNAYCESCSSCGLIFLQHKLNLVYRDARYADLYEETLYNALLGSVDLEGDNFFYQNPLTEQRRRYDWHVCPCCVGNIPRTLLMLPTWTYVKDEDAVYVNLFIGSTMTVQDVAGTDVTLVQETDYPWSGQGAITVKPVTPSSFTIYLRVPDRGVSELYAETPAASGLAALRVNGEPVGVPIERGYAAITRQWQAGDRIEWEMPMAIQRVRGSDQIEATRGQVALRYGPLIYSVESVDQNLDGVLGPDSELNIVWQEHLLRGVMTIRGTWADGTPLLAVPNYARNNRAADGEGDSQSRTRRREGRATESRVWIRER